MTAVPSDKIAKKQNNRKPQQCVVGIVASGLISGSYYNGGGASDVNA